MLLSLALKFALFMGRKREERRREAEKIIERHHGRAILGPQPEKAGTVTSCDWRGINFLSPLAAGLPFNFYTDCAISQL